MASVQLNDQDKEIFFPYIASGKRLKTMLKISNPGSDDALVNLTLFSNGNPQAQTQVLVPAHSHSQYLVSDLFGSVGNGYIKAESSSEISGIEFIINPVSTAGLKAVPSKELATTLYFPLLPELTGLWKIGVCNPSNKSTKLYLDVYREDGSGLYHLSREVPANSSTSWLVHNLLPNINERGSARIISHDEAIAGVYLFNNIGHIAGINPCTLVGTELCFPNAAPNKELYGIPDTETLITILNTDYNNEAGITLRAYPDGTARQFSLKPRAVLSSSVSELFNGNYEFIIAKSQNKITGMQLYIDKDKRISGVSARNIGSLTEYVPSLNIPDYNVRGDSGFNDNLIDLWEYVTDKDTPVDKLVFEIVSQSNPGLVNCVLDNNRFIDCDVFQNKDGYSDISVRVSDNTSSSTDTFRVSTDYIAVNKSLKGLFSGTSISDAVLDFYDNGNPNNGSYIGRDYTDAEGNFTIPSNAECVIIQKEGYWTRKTNVANKISELNLIPKYYNGLC